MIGLGKDFRIYKKRGTDWLNEEWDTSNGPSKKTLGGTLKDMGMILMVYLWEFHWV